MEHVKDAAYVDDEGARHAPDEVDKLYIMEQLHLGFVCPICGNANEQQFDHPLNDSQQYTCTTCGNQYFMLPFLSPQTDSPSDIERIEYQLDCVEKFHEVVNYRPQEAAALASAPEMGTYGTAAVIAGGTGLALLALTGAVQFADLTFLAGFVLAALGLGLGSIGLLFGSVGTLYKGYLIYRGGNYDFSYYEFLRRAGNYYHRNPFVWSA